MMIPFSPIRSDEKKLSSKVNQNFENELETLRSYFKIPGLATIVSQDGNIIYESYQGVADIKTKTPLDDTVQFPIGSLTRIFTEILAMQLAPEKTNNAEELIFSRSPVSDPEIKDIISRPGNNTRGFPSHQNDTNPLLDCHNNLNYPDFDI